jgi:hypothetical protein
MDPCREDGPKAPISPYGDSKYQAEATVSAFINTPGNHGTSLRFFNVVGTAAPELLDNSVENLVPIVLGKLNKGAAPEIFGTDYFSPYMLVTATVNEQWRDKIPAVTHIDGSARFQSVTPRSNERFFKLISKFYEKTSVPVLLNTSFNGGHEPMVETPYDAIKSFLDCNLDFLIAENYIISRL